MERYLLFDSGCTSCSSLAQAIEQESAGWLEAKSLRDPRMQTYFERAQRTLRWQPTLIEVSDQRVTFSTGFALRRKLVQGLGLKRTWRIFQLMQSLQLNSMHTKRRDMFRLGGALLGSLALGAGIIQAKHPQKKVTGELTFGHDPNIDVTKLTVEEAQVLFQEHPQVQLVQQHFGMVDWTQAHLIKHLDTGKSSHLLFLVSQPQTPTWVMFSGTAISNGIVIQFSRDGQKLDTQTIFHPDGTLLGSFTFQEGKLIDAHQAPVRPETNWGCMYNCIWIKLTDGTISGNAYNWCYSCITSHTGITGAINCTFCAYYAGPAYSACLNECP